jgi:hypothetical protein
MTRSSIVAAAAENEKGGRRNSRLHSDKILKYQAFAP